MLARATGIPKRKPEPPLEKDIQFHCTDTTHCYNKVHKIHSYCDDEENQKAELLRHMTDHGRNMNRAIIRNHGDKYIITKHYYQLMPLSLATLKRQGSYGVKGEGYALGYASGKILKISNFLKYSPRLYPQAMPQGK
ncbi:hypothetical protein T12_1824 [Trichinella patagoniensis]|uniref:Uncharacterized protein n=1 Tax=Trichinella patagoniensis TaxID=990121 RepID=A0A0V0ZV60_9BILA|nr:hypothetical protein T12_1824 [Trichinella patagoniensis]